MRALAVGILAAVLTALLWLPHPPQLTADTTGDPDLAEQIRSAATGLDAQGVVAARGSVGTEPRVAAVGQADARSGSARPMTADTPQEIGSVTKSLTGLLLAEMVERGEVDPTTTLAEIHPDAGLDAEVGSITLDELATHRSGLGVVGGWRGLRVLATNLGAGNPYADQSPADLLDEAQRWNLGAGERGGYTYSNLGYALLGHALAEVAGVPYPDLLRQRILEPLGMTATEVTPQPLPTDRAHEVNANGRAVADWSSVGSGPAGAGVWSTAIDLGRLTAAVAAGTAPGQDATTPRADWQGEGSATGWGFFTAEVDGRPLLLNNGATAGGVSSIAVDTATGDWVAVTAPSAVESQTIAFRMLGIGVALVTTVERWFTLTVGLTIALLLLTTGGALTRFLTRAKAPRRPPTRLGLLDGVLTQVLLIAFLAVIGAWATVPPVLFAVAVGAAVFSVVTLLLRGIPDTPSATPSAPRSGASATVASLGSIAVTVVLLALLTGAVP